MLYKERCIKEQIYFELLSVSAFGSLVKVLKTVFLVLNFVQSLKLNCRRSLGNTRLN